MHAQVLQKKVLHTWIYFSRACRNMYVFDVTNNIMKPLIKQHHADFV